ncbi:hypothetical protein QUA21_27800 [Microcoleus sp. Pol1B3]
MPYIEKKTIKRFLGVVLTVDANASSSGTIKQIVNSNAINSVKCPFDFVYDSILAQSPLTTALNREFPTIGFEAIAVVASW